MTFFIPEFLDCPICSSRMEKTNPETDPGTVDFICYSCHLDICQDGRRDEAYENWFSNHLQIGYDEKLSFDEIIRCVKIQSFI